MKITKIILTFVVALIVTFGFAYSIEAKLFVIEGENLIENDVLGGTIDKLGVVTIYSLSDTNFTDIATGSLMYYQGATANKWIDLDIGTDGQVLKVSGDVPVWGSESAKAKTVTVAKSGGEYTTIQGAIDSITDASSTNRYVVEIYAGEYSEALTMKDSISLKGMGNLGDVKIVQTTNDILNIIGFWDNDYSNLFFDWTSAAAGDSLITINTGLQTFYDCYFLGTSAANARLRMFDINGGVVLFYSSYFKFDHNATASHGGNNIMFDIDGNPTLLFKDGAFDMDIDSDDNVYMIDDNSTASVETFLVNNNAEIDMATTSLSSDIIFYRSKNEDGELHIQNNHIHLDASGASQSGVCAAIWLDTGGNSGILESYTNDIRVENCGANYSFDVDTTDSIHSHFDTIEAVDGDFGAGSVIRTNSPSDGNFAVSGTITGDVTGDLTGNADTATALAANGANCSAGSYPLGVDASGATESCTDATTEIDSAISAIPISHQVGFATGTTAYAIGNGTSTKTHCLDVGRTFVSIGGFCDVGTALLEFNDVTEFALSTTWATTTNTTAFGGGSCYNVAIGTFDKGNECQYTYKFTE